MPSLFSYDLKNLKTKTKSGWFTVTLLIVLLYYPLFYGFIGMLNPKVPNLYLIIIFVFPLTVLEISWLISWVIYSGRILITKPNKITILFAVSVEEESQNIFRELLKSFKRELNTADLSHLFQIRELEGIKFNGTRAEEYVVNERINLLIWGDTEELTSNGESVTDFKLNFTYWYKAPSVRSPDFQNIIDIGLQRRAWRVFHLHTLPTLRIVSANLSESSIFIISRCLMTFGFLKIAFDLLFVLNKHLLEIGEKSEFPNYTQFKKIIEIHLIELGSLVCFAFIKQDNTNEAEKYGLKALRLSPSYFPTLLNLAMIYWKKGDEVQAREFSARARKVDPSNVLNRFNKAFFFIIDKNYQKAANQYRQISSLPTETNILDIIDFLELEYENKAEEIALLFAAGYLNYQFADQIRGRKQLADFLKLSTEKPKYKPLIDLTIPLIK